MNAKLSKNMEDKIDDKIKIFEFKIQEILANSTNLIKKRIIGIEEYHQIQIKVAKNRDQ